MLVLRRLVVSPPPARQDRPRGIVGFELDPHLVANRGNAWKPTPSPL